MKLRCPSCRYEYDYVDATTEQAQRETLLMLPDFSPHHRLVFEYAELFGAARSNKSLKLRRILGEIHEIFVKGQFAFQKRVHRISREGIAGALKTVCNRTFSEPLTNHNYLKKVMLSVAEEESKRRSANAEKELKTREAALRAGQRPNAQVKGPGEATDGPAPIGEIMKSMPWNR